MLSEGYDIEGKRITILGAARSGVAAAVLLASHGADVFLSEKSAEVEKTEEVDILSKASIESEFGEHTSRVYDADLWVISPGIPLDSPPVKEAAKRSIPIVGELEAASWFCEVPIVAVTGSNGKSTTTALIGAIFKAAGIPCIVAGNIGQPFSSFVETIPADGIAVVEVSSFQLETIRSFHPKIAVFLNLTPDHLDRHGSMANYGALKARIFKNQDESDFIVYNAGDALVSGLANRAPSKKVAFGREGAEKWYGEIREGKLAIHLDKGWEEILPVSDMVIRGEHNTINALASSLAGRLGGAPLEAISDALQTFKGLPHRMEIIRVLNEVSWVNDSKATNVDSVRYALDSYDGPVIWIAGGRDKDSDFSALIESVEEHAKAVILLGEAAEKIDGALNDIRPTVFVESLDEAVAVAGNLSRPGDVVLLSPGCASFDMFRDFEDRGDRFRTIVEAL